MDGLWGLLILAGLFYLLILPILVFTLFNKVGKLEEEVTKLRKKTLESSRKEESQKVSVTSSTKEKSAPVSPPPVPVVTEPILAVERKTHTPAVKTEVLRESPTLSKEPVKPAEPPVEKEAQWKPLLAKVGLLPPDEREASLAAWWTTRIGLGLGVITAVFLGIYVNQDTNPMMRLLQLIGVALLVLCGGLYLERKLRGFGQALAYGGLSLLYVAGYACYGLPAMKVTESPWMGFWAQVLAFLAIAGFSLWRGQPRGFTLALVLGYITSYFSLREGIAPMPYFSLVSLAGVGLMIYVMRNWLAALLLSLLGTGGGLTLYCWLSSPAIFTSSAPPSAVPMLLTSLFLCLLYLATLCWRHKEAAVSSEEKHYLPSVTFGVWLLAGVSAFFSIGLKAEWAYASFSIVALVSALGWRIHLQDQKQFISFIIKASALIATCIISWMDGSTRAFALLGQACTLLILAHRERSKVLEGSAAVVWLIGFFLMVQSFPKNVVADYGSAAEWIRMAFLVGSLAVVLFHQRLYQVKAWKERAILQGILIGGIGIALSVSCGNYLGGTWAWGIPLALTLVFYFLGQRLTLLPRLVLPLVVLGAMVLGLLFSSVEWESSVLWIASCWAFIYWERARFLEMLASVKRKPHLILHHVLLLLSMVIYFRLGDLILPSVWLPVWMLCLAVCWKALGKLMPYLSLTSFIPAVVAVLSVMINLSAGDLLPKLGVIILTVLYFFIGKVWLRSVHEGYSPSQAGVAEWFRMIILCSPYVIFLQGDFSNWSMEWRCACFILLGVGVNYWGRWIRERALCIGGGVFFLCALVLAHDFSTWSGFGVSCLLLLGLIFTGLGLGRGAASVDAIFHPRKTAGVYGALSFIVIFWVWSNNGVGESFLTALWSLGSVLLVLSGFIGKLRTYRVLGLVGLALSLGKLFIYDMDDTFWRIIGFGVTSLLFIGLGYLYNKFHQRLATGDLDWGKEASPKE